MTFCGGQRYALTTARINKGYHSRREPGRSNGWLVSKPDRRVQYASRRFATDSTSTRLATSSMR